jgi:hypothetical protein
LLQESNLIHIRQIQPVRVAPGGADPGDQSDRNAQVSGSLGVGFHPGAVDEALFKIIQTTLENITRLRLMNQATGLVAHRVGFSLRVLAGGNSKLPPARYLFGIGRRN